MKKIVAFILLLCILFMTACRPDPVSPQPTEEPQIEEVPTTPQATETPQTEPPTLDGQIDAVEMLLQVQSDARYVFEQIWLPHMVFEFESEEIAAFIKDSNVEGMRENLLLSWEFVAMQAIIEMFGERIFDGPDLDILGQLYELRFDEHVVDVTIESLDEETSAFIIEMLDIEQFLRSTYIAIVYSEAHGLALFTLEQSHGFHMFCFIEIDSRGSFFEVENNREAFVEAIRSVL